MIIGTDWWTDCDDAVAMRILTKAHKHGCIEILGVGISACMEHSVTSLDAFFCANGLGDIVLGIDREATDFGGVPGYQERLSKLPSKYKNNSECEDVVRLYRRLLAVSDDKIDIVEIGYPQVLANLLKSEEDDISKYSGTELVKQKVNKLWMMAGKWDDLQNGKENNFARNERSRTAANYLCKHWPVPITFLGWEVSFNILTGDKLKTDDVLYRVMCDYNARDGRHSWDPMLVLMACINDEQKAGYKTMHGTASVDAATGVNNFCFDENGRHKFVVKIYEDDFYKNAVNNLL